MAENDRVKPEDFSALGYEMGRMAAAFLEGFWRGYRDYDAGSSAPASSEPDIQEEASEEAETDICRWCWCNTCLKLEECDAFPASVDGIRPPPCAACPDNAKTPLMPRNAPAECGTYEAVPKDCQACWCKGCENFENCIVEKEGYDPDSQPCPCDGCKKGERYMPKEKPPTCEYYTKGNEDKSL